jgi:transposase
VGYFGATSLDTGQMTYQRADSFNARTFEQFLRKLLRSASQNRKKIYLMVDNARWHHAKLLQEFLEHQKDRLVLWFLPPYSPELNPQERVWRQTRRQATHNKYFEQEKELIREVESTFLKWSKPNDELWNLCAFK